MRKDFLLFLSFLVDAGYIVSFRVTKDKIFIDEAVRAVASLPGGGRKETARERRGNNENAVIYI